MNLLLFYNGELYVNVELCGAATSNGLVLIVFLKLSKFLKESEYQKNMTKFKNRLISIDLK
jgi:hypothetical protein